MTHTIETRKQQVLVLAIISFLPISAACAGKATLPVASSSGNQCADGESSKFRCFDNLQGYDYHPSNRKDPTTYIATDAGTDSEWDTHALVTLKKQPTDPNGSCLAPPTNIVIPGLPGLPGHTLPTPPMSLPFPQPLVQDGTLLFIQTNGATTTLYLMASGKTLTRTLTKAIQAGRITYLSAISPGNDGDIYDYFVKFRSEPPLANSTQNKRLKNYVVEAFYTLQPGSPLDDCDKERPDSPNSPNGPAQRPRQPGSGQGNEPVH